MNEERNRTDADVVAELARQAATVATVAPSADGTRQVLVPDNMRVTQLAPELGAKRALKESLIFGGWLDFKAFVERFKQADRTSLQMSDTLLSALLDWLDPAETAKGLAPADAFRAHLPLSPSIAWRYWGLPTRVKDVKELNGKGPTMEARAFRELVEATVENLAEPAAGPLASALREIRITAGSTIDLNEGRDGSATVQVKRQAGATIGNAASQLPGGVLLLALPYELPGLTDQAAELAKNPWALRVSIELDWQVKGQGEAGQSLHVAMRYSPGSMERELRGLLKRLQERVAAELKPLPVYRMG